MSARRSGMAEVVARAQAGGRKPTTLLDIRAEPRAELDAAALAVELAAEIGEGCVSGSDLAVALGRRKADVLTVLASDPQFVRVGRGRTTCWRLQASTQGTGREPISGHAMPDPDRQHPPTSTEPLIGSRQEAA